MNDGLLCVEVDGDDEAVETQYLGENENQDHTDEQTGLLGGTSHTGVADDADSEAGRETGEPDRQTGTQMNETPGIVRQSMLISSISSQTKYRHCLTIFNFSI